MSATTERVAVHADGGYCHGVALIAGRCPSCGLIPDAQSVELWDAPLTVRDRPSRPRGLSALDATGLVELAGILADTLDSRRWRFYEGDPSVDDNGDGTTHQTIVEESDADADRLNFIAEVHRRIIAKSAPAAAKAGDGNGGAKQ